MTAGAPDSRTRGPLGVVLDLGNVVVDWQPFPAVAAGVGEHEAQLFLEASDFDFFAWNHLLDEGLPWEQAEDVVRRDHPRWLTHVQAYRAHFPASLVGDVPGTAELVDDLVAAGVPVWGLTNWSAELYHAHAPARFAVLGRFEGVVVSGEEGVAKPDPEAYRRVSARSGLPLDRLVFADDKQVNVDAARALGMDAVLFTGSARLRTDLRQRGLAV